MRVRHDFRLIELSKVSNAVLSVDQPVAKITHCSVSSQFRPKKPSETILKENICIVNWRARLH